VQPLAVDALALTRMIEVCISPVSDLWNEAIERSAPAAIEPGGSSGWKAKSAPQASSMISGMSCAWQGERELVVVDRIDVDRSAPLRIRPEATDLWTLRATATSWPGWVAATTAICTLSVEPLVENMASSAPNASAARSCA